MASIGQRAQPRGGCDHVLGKGMRAIPLSCVGAVRPAATTRTSTASSLPLPPSELQSWRYLLDMSQEMGSPTLLLSPEANPLSPVSQLSVAPSVDFEMHRLTPVLKEEDVSRGLTPATMLEEEAVSLALERKSGEPGQAGSSAFENSRRPQSPLPPKLGRERFNTWNEDLVEEPEECHDHYTVGCLTQEIAEG